MQRAATEFALSVELKQRAYTLTPNSAKLAADLANSLSWQARAQIQLGKLEQAEKLGAREMALLQSLHRDYPAETLWVNGLSSAWSHLSELKQARGDLSGSHEAIQQAYTLLQTIVEKDPSNRTWQRNLYIAELRVIETEDGQQAWNQMLTRLNKLQQSFGELIRLEPKKLNLQVMLANVQQRKAAIYLRERQLGDARANLGPAVEKLQQLHAATPSDLIIRNGLVDALLLNAEILEHQDLSDASGNCEKVLTVLRPVIKGSADFHILAPWVKAHACLNLTEHAAPQLQQLEAMSYRDPAYLRYLSTHPTKKAST